MMESCGWKLIEEWRYTCYNYWYKQGFQLQTIRNIPDTQTARWGEFGPNELSSRIKLATAENKMDCYLVASCIKIYPGEWGTLLYYSIWILHSVLIYLWALETIHTLRICCSPHVNIDIFDESELLNEKLWVACACTKWLASKGKYVVNTTLELWDENFGKKIQVTVERIQASLLGLNLWCCLSSWIS